MRHELKTVQPFFDYIWNGQKTFEIRKNDRNFKAGDELVLKEYCEERGFLNRKILCKVPYIVYGKKEYEISEGYCIMSIIIIDKVITNKIIK